MAVRVIVTLFHSLTAISQVIRASFQALHISARKVEWRRVITSMQICHFPRILLNFYEMMVIEEAMACSAAGKRAFAVWAQVRE